MLSIRLNKNMEKLLNDMASATKTTKTALIKDAIEQYIEDKIDYMEAMHSLKNTNNVYSLEEIVQEFKNDL